MWKSCKNKIRVEGIFPNQRRAQSKADPNPYTPISSITLFCQQCFTQVKCVQPQRKKNKELSQ